LAIAQAIEKNCGVKCSLKWPNDVLIDHKKICGILTEMSGEINGVHWVVLGFGLNVNNALPATLKSNATTLKTMTQTLVNRQRLLQSNLKSLEKNYFIFLKQGFSPFKKQYLRQLIFKKKDRLTITEYQHPKTGTFEGISDQGSLRLNIAGKEESFLAGDVSIKK
jgi:BirA family biotin operon repressor/biotin-[acetyl-CoA-carboxylase] ligase